MNLATADRARIYSGLSDSGLSDLHTGSVCNLKPILNAHILKRVVGTKRHPHMCKPNWVDGWQSLMYLVNAGPLFRATGG